MNFAMTRRQILAVGAVTGMTSALAALPVGGELEKMRKIVSWGDAQQCCWFEGFAAEVPIVLADAQAVFREPALFHHLDYCDLQAALGLGLSNADTLPVVHVGCATNQSVLIAVEDAFAAAAACGAAAGSSSSHVHGALVMLSVPPSDWKISELKKIGAWAGSRMAEGGHYVIQVLGDSTLETSLRRLSLAIAFGGEAVDPAVHFQAAYLAEVPTKGRLPRFLL